MLIEVLGGIGLFLLGIMLLTDGLKALAGEALRSILERFVRGPLSGVGWGTLITMLVQSSSATTLMTIGFVSAGLLTFAQSIGVILGANLGTTSTGWIVSTIGLNVNMGTVALPMIALGAALRLLGGERVAPVGTALAGFGLLFVGIGALQEGMAGVAERIDPSRFPGMTVTGVPLLVLIGVLMTVVVQSSSAAVAITIAALHSGAISLEQAAVLVIGQNVGTTIKAGLAAIGASLAARRTALVHILFNVVTGILALAALPLFLVFMRWVASQSDEAADPAAVALAAFHTSFSVLGVAAFLPFVGRFAAWVERLLPERKPLMARELDASVATIPSVAVEAARRTLRAILVASAQAARAPLGVPAGRAAASRQLDDAEQALDAAQRFLGKLWNESETSGDSSRHLALVHAVDHVARLIGAARDVPAGAARHDDRGAEELAAALEELLGVLALVAEHGDRDFEPEDVARAQSVAGTVAESGREQRSRLLARVAAGRLSPQAAAQQLDGFAWAGRVAHHLWRALHYLQQSPGEEARQALEAPSDLRTGEPEN